MQELRIYVLTKRKKQLIGIDTHKKQHNKYYKDNTSQDGFESYSVFNSSGKNKIHFNDLTKYKYNKDFIHRIKLKAYVYKLF